MISNNQGLRVTFVARLAELLESVYHIHPIGDSSYKDYWGAWTRRSYFFGARIVRRWYILMVLDVVSITNLPHL